MFLEWYWPQINRGIVTFCLWPNEHETAHKQNPKQTTKRIFEQKNTTKRINNPTFRGSQLLLAYPHHLHRLILPTCLHRSPWFVFGVCSLGTWKLLSNTFIPINNFMLYYMLWTNIITGPYHFQQVLFLETLLSNVYLVYNLNYFA